MRVNILYLTTVLFLFRNNYMNNWDCNAIKPAAYVQFNIEIITLSEGSFKAEWGIYIKIIK